MVQMRKLLFAFLVIALAGYCSAASVEIKDTLPAETVWSFSVFLPNGVDFGNAEVLLDSSRLAYFQTDSADQVVLLEKDNSRLFSVSSASSNRVYLLVAPLVKGDHTVSLKVDGASIVEKTISFFEIGSFDDKQSMQDKIASLNGSVNTVINQINNLEEDALTQEDRQELQASINELQGKLDSLEAELKQDAQNKANVLVGDIQVLQQRVDDLNKAAGFGIGFALLPEVKQETVMIALLAVAAVLAIALIVKFRDRIPLQRNMYGKFKKDAPVFSVRDDEISEQVSSQAAEIQSGSGKWAFEETASKPKRGFGFRDMLKK